MTPAESLSAWGILRAADVVAIAAAAGLPLAAAAALLEQESGGGRNVWGHDAVPTGGAYIKGDQVDEPSYHAYRAALATGRAGQQGCGPCQLTAVSFQNAADDAGGCWLPVPNMRVGFSLLATYARQWPLADAYRAYNGGPGNRVAGRNAAADAYAAAAIDRYDRWTVRLGGNDMPLSQADADLIVHTLLGTPLADLYPNTPTTTMTVGAHLQWAAANAGRALTVAQKIRDLITATPTSSPELRAELVAALHDLGPLYLVHDEVAQAGEQQ